MVTKKTSAKKTAKAKTVSKAPVETAVVRSSETKTSSTETRKGVNRTAVTIGVIVLLLALLYLFRSAFVVGFVNGQPITKSEFSHQMEKDAGKQAMNEILTKDLIFQEAQKKHITISDAEVNKEMKTIEDTLKKQGQNLDQALTAKGLSRQDLVDQIKIKQIVDKILAPQVKVTDQEVTDYMDKNKDSLPVGQNTDQLKTSIKTRLQQDKLSQKFQDWIAGLQQKAKIDYLIKI